jgi:triosephosphate isomerase
VKTYIIGNWKSYKTTAESLAWLEQFSPLFRESNNVEVVIAPPFLVLEGFSKGLADKKLNGVALAAQDVSPFPRGSYTGAIAADMLKPLVQYVIVGHSERRRYFHETPQDVINKVTEAADSGLVPIVCVEDADLLAQLRPLADIDCKQMLVAYTPVDAINFNIPESVERIGQAVSKIRAFFPAWPIIYGGAVGENNAKEYLAVPGLAGLFLGSTSLDAIKFSSVCQIAQNLTG